MVNKTIKTVLLVWVTLPVLAWGSDDVTLTPQQKYSYAVGYGIGKGMQQNNIEVDIDVFAAAVEDAIANNEPKINENEMMDAAKAHQLAQQKRNKAMTEERETAGQEFLNKNKLKEGVVALASGLQYEVLEKGQGLKPTAEDTVSVHYEGRLLNDSVFDSSYERGIPAEFPVMGVIQGWQEGLQLMKQGAKWRFFIPPALAYGDMGAGAAIGPGETLVFDVELLAIK